MGNRMFRATMVSTLLLIAVPFAAVCKQPAKAPITFFTTVKLLVDASGVPTKVEVDPKLPTTLRTHIERTGAGWRFEPVRVGGVAGSGSTYVRLGGCAVPEANGGYRFAVDYHSSGPGTATGAMLPPAYPPEAQLKGIEGTMRVVIAVGADGKGRLEGTEFIGADPRHGRFFERTARDWVRGLRFLPEEFAGRPLQTRIRVPVEFKLGPDTYADAVAERDREVAASSTCSMAAGGPSMLPVALDSPFRKLPAGG